MIFPSPLASPSPSLDRSRSAICALCIRRLATTQGPVRIVFNLLSSFNIGCNLNLQRPSASLFLACLFSSDQDQHPPFRHTRLGAVVENLARIVYCYRTVLIWYTQGKRFKVKLAPRPFHISSGAPPVLEYISPAQIDGDRSGGPVLALLHRTCLSPRSESAAAVFGIGQRTSEFDLGNCLGMCSR